MFRKLVLILAVAVMGPTALSGETIRVLMGNNNWTDAAKEHIPAFEKETGIKVQLETYGNEQLSQKTAVEMTAGGGDIDVINLRMMEESRMYVLNDWVEDLNKYVKDDAEYDIGDYSDSALAACTVDGVLTVIPTISESAMIFYRKDVFAKHGVQPPKTFDELEQVAAKVTDRENEFYGFVSRGQKSPMVTQLSSYVYGYGGDFFDKESGKALLDTPEFLGAVEYYGRMLRNYGPDGVLNMSWPQGVAIFQQGKGAMYVDCSSQYNMLMDPTKSTVAEHTGVAMFPAGPKRHRFFYVNAWGLGISSKSAKKDAAWKFIRYLTDKERTTYMQGTQMVQCSRISPYNNPEGMKNFPADWSQVARDSIPFGVGHDRPEVIAVGEARDLIGDIGVAAILNADYKKVARESNAKFQKLLDREGFGK